MGAKLYTYFKENWRTTLIGIIGAICVAVSNYLASGDHITLTGIGLAAAVAVVGTLSKDAKNAHLGMVNGLLLKYGESAVMEALQQAIKEQNEKANTTSNTTK